MADNGDFTDNDEARESEWHKALVASESVSSFATDPQSGIAIRYVKQYDIETDTQPCRDICLSNVQPPSLRAELIEQRTALIAYLLSKVKAADWHAVQDAASDIREINAKLDVLGA